MLAPSLPVFMPISQAFDLNDAEDNKQAKLYFDRFRAVGGTVPACRGGVARPVDMVLDSEHQFWIKVLTPQVLDRGL